MNEKKSKAELTRKQQEILSYLKGKPWASPNKIGMDVGGKTASGLWRHSSWASPTCLKLVKKGLLERNKAGQYRIVTPLTKILASIKGE